MIKILNTQQIKALDAFTIQQEGILSIDLMERACRAFVDWFVQHIDARKKIGVVCGTGNNGGDGLGIARILSDWGYPVTIWIVRGSGSESEDFKTNLERVQRVGDVNEITTSPSVDTFSTCDVLIDAMFGSGLSRALDGIYADTIRAMNQSDALRVAVDIPSGLLVDKTSSGEIFKADYTVTFQLPKLSFLLPQSYAFTGEWIVVDIGLSKKFIRESSTSNYVVSESALKEILKPRARFDHKGTFGHALMITGSYGKMGAAILSSRAALRAGVGLLTTHIPKCGYVVFQTAVPEAMAIADRDENFFSEIDNTDKFNVIGIGPGLGQDSKTVEAFKSVLKNFGKPMVIDADALNILSGNPGMMEAIPEESILTPHPKEFERLAGKPKDDFDRLDRQRALASKLKSVVIVKGSFSTIASPDGTLYFNSTGNPGMATGGTGDVLTGILTGLLAQGYRSVDVAIAGVYLHGLSGDLAAVEKGQHSLVASDLIEFLPQSFVKTGCK